ncbi:hypothetical protein EDB92DRAFT_2113767 [Lactarius akahatsu]|uniref:Uncharacterized protein n=1 Tax=Lactarius akahatsu TaxID=416441 RepID=A0AAD4Q902_9AGAM|nr:hypothetical protein EDB92DRAFT_2113767 [Lactarius akahatsu]
MAASNIAKLFKAFPDLEEYAIKLMPCMASVKTRTPTCVIRIEGYKAIVRMSEEQPRWLERNVGVLVQLLQSDEPEEVTLGVLCDQIELSDGSMEDEDKTIHDRLHALVAAFLTQDARKPLLAQLQGQGRGAAKQEDALIDTLIKAVSKSSVADAAKISSSFCPLSTTDGRGGAGTRPRARAEPGEPGGAVFALFFAPSPIKTGSSESDLEIWQSTGSAYDTICSDVMCIECSVDGGTARYILRTTGNQNCFGRNIGDSPMVVVWPSRGADSKYISVALSQRKAPYEVMPAPDPYLPFTAKLSITDTYMRAPLYQSFRFFIAFCAGHRGEPPNSFHSESPAGWNAEHHLDIQPHAPGIGGPRCPYIDTPHNLARHARIPTIPAEPPVPFPPPPPVHPDIPTPIPKKKTTTTRRQLR